jgi:glycosyltransferase involved in cell wall biosynthesis
MKDRNENQKGESAARRVLIAHQSTIPHYRVPFYNLLEQRRPASWEFEVVFDSREVQRPRIYMEPIDPANFHFPVRDTRTSIFCAGGRRLIWQHFFAACRNYDLIITDTHLNNLTYPAVSLFQLAGKSRIFWGHFRDMNIVEKGPIKRAMESLKLWLIRRADVCLAYTPGTAEELCNTGYPRERIFVLNNTIDISAERQAFIEHRSRRDEYRQKFGVAGKKVLLFVGRLVPGKQIKFLLDSFRAAYRLDSNLHLFIVGAGPLQSLIKNAAANEDGISWFGGLSDRERLAPVFSASDLFILTGMVGLAPLQAFSYDLPAIVFEVPTHGPEIEYLDERNSVTLPGETTPQQFAEVLPSLIRRFEDRPRSQVFESISHLTLENMVSQFIAGVNAALARK